MEWTAPERIFQYEIKEKVGQGKNGTVYKALDVTCGQVVALKLILPDVRENPEFERRSLPALKAVSRLDHPNICTVYDLIENDGWTIVVMEYIAGMTIEQLIETNPLPVNRFLEIAIPVAQALDFADREDLTHGNIQPSNIMIRQDGLVKVMDFGLPRRRCGKTGLAAGFSRETLSYVTPEEIRDELTGRSTDYFSLGAVFCEMLGGRVPFSGKNRTQVAHSILYDQPDLQPVRERDVRGDIILLLERLLAKRKSDRCTDSRELVITLEAIGSYWGDVTAQDYDPPARRWTPRLRLLVPLVVVILTLLWMVATTYR